MVSSKVRFSDARAINVTEKNCYWKKRLVNLPELSSPKYNNVNFYLESIFDNREKHDSKRVLNVDVYKDKNEFHLLGKEEIKIRGHKEYWHHYPRDFEVDNNNRNVTVNPVKVGVKYQFKVYFNDITKLQLEHLCCAISLGPEEKFAHKIGMGKPLGYGSVVMRTKKVFIRELKVCKETYDISRKCDEYIPENKSIEEVFGEILNQRLLEEI